MRRRCGWWCVDARSVSSEEGWGLTGPTAASLTSFCSVLVARIHTPLWAPFANGTQWGTYSRDTHSTLLIALHEMK